MHCKSCQLEGKSQKPLTGIMTIHAETMSKRENADRMLGIPWTSSPTAHTEYRNTAHVSMKRVENNIQNAHVMLNYDL